MDAGGHATTRHVIGRVKAIAPKEQLRGHAVRARSEGRVLDSSVTDGAGRFLLTWTAGGEGKIVVELLGAEGDASESVEIDEADLVSPPVVGLSGKALVGPHISQEEDIETKLEADGDHPVCVTSSRIPVTLSWKAPAGTEVSLLSTKRALGRGLAAAGSLTVAEEATERYKLLITPSGRAGKPSELTVEVRRYPTLSLVMEGATFRRGSVVDFGVSISSPAGRGGLLATVLTSDELIVPTTGLAIPSGATWATTRVRLGQKPGKVKVTATAPGFVRDGVTFLVE